MLTFDLSLASADEPEVAGARPAGVGRMLELSAADLNHASPPAWTLAGLVLLLSPFRVEREAAEAGSSRAALAEILRSVDATFVLGLTPTGGRPARTG